MEGIGMSTGQKQRLLIARTAIIIAHRLSTVRNADQIIVLDGGRIIEKDMHLDLIELKESYYNLVKNQLELERLNQGYE